MATLVRTPESTVAVPAVIWKVASGVLVAAMPVLLIGFNLDSLLFDPLFYGRGQAQHAVGRTTELTLDALRPINVGIVSFFRSPGVSLAASLAEAGASGDVFNSRELGHMEDVRSIVRDIVRLQNVAIAVAAAAAAARFVQSGSASASWIAGRVFTGAIGTLGLVALLGLATLVDFEKLFLTFHLLSFDNDLWRLDPRKDNLIRFFPFEFWLDATVTLAVRTVLTSMMVAFGAYLLHQHAVRRLV